MRARRGSTVSAVALTVLTTASPVGAAPADNATTLSVSPSSVAPRSALTLTGFSDCAVVDGHLVFTRYDGAADNVVVRAPQATRYDDAREKYPFAVRLTVPAQARPGSVRVYAEPFCGPPEEYPPSGSVQVRVVPGALTLSVFPRRPVEGGRLRLTASTCNGPQGRVTFAVRAGDSSERVTATVDSQGRARTSVEAPRGVDVVEVSLPDVVRECPGSRYAGARNVRINRVVQPVAPSATMTSARPSPSPPPSVAAVASPSAEAGPFTTVPTAPVESPGLSGPVIAAVVAALAAAAAGLAVTRRRRRN